MRFFPLLLVSLGLVCVRASSSSSSSSSSEEDDGEGCSGNVANRVALAASRIDMQAFRLERLGSKLDKMQARMGDIDKSDESNHATGLAARLDKLEGGGCLDDEFRCGRDRQCVKTTLVCDTIPDCHNGRDEDDDVCKKNLAESGSTFTGHVRWNACKANPEAEMTITISRNTVIEYFRPRVWLSANVNLEYDEGSRRVGHANSHEGFYNFGRRRLVLQPAKGDHIGAVCDFFTDDMADCTITEVGTLTACARVRVSRQ